MSARPSASRLVVWALAGSLLCGIFVALGSWQVARRAWKLDLIARVEQRVHAPAQEAPARAAWARINANDDAYRHIRLRGIFQHENETLVQAVTTLGPGFWVLTPLRIADGSVVLINRGFVPTERRERSSRPGNEPAGEQTISGLLRISEPDGAFLRGNDPAANRWYSRDVAAIAAARGLGATSSAVAPYFVDADAVSNPSSDATAGRWPVGGLTVVSFHNSHLVYAITWYVLALMVAAGTIFLWRTERRRLQKNA
ncbi:SURF1 family protein [Uliginosibacterium sp. H3]|uniref:SURF1-like protein n=1 Tax=Uliginosibacterium silvisoli TaxID=3114758 RepID=A0ABU6K1T1_9RHOO|nr:SURF1 family protein [Uliginosibacterium sp. H3]